jgi:hypothetical protein
MEPDERDMGPSEDQVMDWAEHDAHAYDADGPGEVMVTCPNPKCDGTGKVWSEVDGDWVDCTTCEGRGEVVDP